MDKKSIRQLIIKKRDSLSMEEKQKKDLIIKDKLTSKEYFKNSKNIFIYVGFGSEINTATYIEEFISLGKKICIPRTNVENKTMEAVKIDSLEELVKNKYGILEPTGEKEIIKKEEIDLVILPGVAFDNKGGRLGYGGGYYDKYLMNLPQKVVKVALAYDFQIINEVPKEEHDIEADFIITDKK